MEKVIQVVDEQSFITLVSILDETTGIVIGAKASIIELDIITKSNKEDQWVKYDNGEDTLKIILKR